ncbi:MAG: TRAP transporter small permease [Alphaproteobacteria bacterium]
MLRTVIERYDVLTRAVFRFGAYFALSCMTIVIGVDAGGRYLFNAPLSGGNDIVSLLLLTLFLSLLGHSYRSDLHVRMDLLYTVLPNRPRRLVQSVSAVGALVFAALLGTRGWHDMWVHLEVASGSPTLHIPVWPFDLLIVVASAMFAISIVLSVLGNVVPDPFPANTSPD